MSKYTVILLETPQDIAALAERLQVQFKLKPEQAQVLAKRPIGSPLMKPTELSRAEQVAQFYQSCGVKVRIHEVPEPASTPLPSPAPVSPVSEIPRSRPVVGSSNETPPSRPVVNPEPTAIPEQRSEFRPRAVVGSANPASSTSEVPTPERPSRSFRDRAAVSATPTSEVSARIRPTVGGHTPDEPTTPIPTRAPTHRSVISADTPAASAQDSSNRIPRLSKDTQDRLPTGTGTTDDLRASQEARIRKLTGAPPSTGTVESDPKELTLTQTDTFSVPTGDADANLPNIPATKARFSLVARILFTAVLPLLIFAMATIGFYIYSLNNTLRQVQLENVKQLTLSLATSVNLVSLETADNQISSLVRQSDIGFIMATTENWEVAHNHYIYGDNEFVEALKTFITAQPKATQYAWKYNLTPPSNIPEDAKRINEKHTYLLERLYIYDQDGKRTVSNAESGKPQMTLLVGLRIDDSLFILRNYLFILLALSIITLIIGITLSLITARRITQPLVELAKAADRISLGELDHEPIEVKSNDEIGELATALERMRTSLSAAIDRLRRRRR